MPATTTFIVAVWESSRQRQSELQQVQASSHEAAVAMVAASRTLADQPVVYEAWPASEPGSILRITLEARRPWRPLAD